MQQILDMQDILYRDCHDPNVPAGYRAQCARAWDVLEERKRILRGIPAPRPVDTVQQQQTRARRRLPMPEPTTESA